MKKSYFIALLSVTVVLGSCAGNNEKRNAKKLADGVYQKEGWIYDMKELPSGKDVIPFYTVGTLSTNVLENYFTNPPAQMGITLYFVLDKKGENKNKIVSAYLESTASDESLFKFPRCLSICPVNIEIINADGSRVESKMTYSRPNVFKRLNELIDYTSEGIHTSGGTLILNKRKLRVRALPKNLPDFITADISGLELGNKLYTSQLPAEGFSFLHPDNTVVCQVKTSRASIKNAQTEGAEGEGEESEEAAE